MADWDLASFPLEDRFPGLDTSLPKLFVSPPDVDGRFRFNDVPVHGHHYLITAAKGLGEAQWMNDWKSRSFDQPIEITTEMERKLFGQVRSAACAVSFTTKDEPLRFSAWSNRIMAG